jgi:site-specific DNA recombinase
VAAGTQDASQIAAGIYCRISLAGIGDTTKTDDQERISRDLAARLEWPVVRTYTDHSQSAWKKNRKREAWDEMLADIDAGRISAVIVYHGDRLIRQPWDLEKLLNLAESKGVRLASPTGIRNLDNADDRFILRIEAAQACRASDDTSRRKKAQYERMRRQGITRPRGHGGRCFGFETDGVTHVPSEAEAVRQAAAAVLAGQSLGLIARRLAAQNVTTPAGRPVTVRALHRILTYPRMAGLMPDATSAAAWTPVLERGDWEAVRALISLNKSLPNAGRGALHLLSGIAACGLCGHPLWAGYNDRKPAYKCHGCGKIGRSLALLDDYIAGYVAGRLANSANPAGRVLETPGLAAEFASLTAARAEIEEVLADHTRGSVPALLARLDSLDKRLAELRGLAGDDARDRLLAAYAGITEDEFGALPLQVRRSLVSACVTVVVLPASKRGPGFRTEDVQVTAR